MSTISYWIESDGDHRVLAVIDDQSFYTPETGVVRHVLTLDRFGYLEDDAIEEDHLFETYEEIDEGQANNLVPELVAVVRQLRAEGLVDERV